MDDRELHRECGAHKLGRAGDMLNSTAPPPPLFHRRSVLTRGGAAGAAVDAGAELGLQRLLAEAAVSAKMGDGRGTLKERAMELAWRGGALATAASQAAKRATKEAAGGTGRGGGKGKAGGKGKGSGRGSGGGGKGKGKGGQATYRQYADGWSCPLRSVPPHATLASNRGEKEKELTVSIKFSPNDTCVIEGLAATLARARCARGTSGHDRVRRLLEEAAKDGVSRLLLPALQRAARRRLTEAAMEAAMESFGGSLRGLLLGRPCKGRRVVALDPGFRNGVKYAALSEDGELLGHSWPCGQLLP